MIQVTCALIVKDRKILVAQKDGDSDHPNQWEFPGGKLNDNENEEACIIREIKEELNIEILPTKKLFAIEHDYQIKSIRLIPFVCSIKSGEIKLIEHQAVQWTTLSHLLRLNLAEADKRLLTIKKNLEELKKHIRE